jgi:uncharacterized protein (UPF0261 family)
MAQVGKIMAERLNGAKGPTAVLIPLRGWSIYGARGGPLYDEAGYTNFLKALKNQIRAHIRLEEVDAHINDPLFADRCVEQLVEFMNEGRDFQKTS